ncbi:MAG: hypothetical protein SF123_12765 [Chloroflexota bacterium]|nr:hypothetical protein [Chloroflexota bacterium]
MQRVIFFASALLLLTFAPLYAQSDAVIRADRLGIAHISSVDVPRSDERYQRALDLGASWNRWPLYWDRVETRRGAFDWSAYDELVIEDLSHDLNLNVILLGIPAHRREGDTIANLHEPIFNDDTDLPDGEKAINPQNPWAVFVRDAVRRYMPGGVLAEREGWTDAQGVRVWEIWNEPDYEFFWSGGVRDYARLLQVAYLVIKAHDPNATVMMGGLLYPTQANWLARVLAIYHDEIDPEANNWYMDAVAIHNYGDAWRTGWLTLVVRQTLVEYGLERPIWVTETGVPLWDDYPGPTWTADAPDARGLLATAEQQAAFMVQSAAYAWAEGARVIIYHQLYDDCGNQPPGTDFAPGATATPICQPGEICAGDVFGMFTNPESAICFSQHPQPDSARPVANAFRLLADVFAQPFSRRGAIDDVRDDAAVLISFTRPETDERIVVIWNTATETLELSLPAYGANAALYAMDGQRSIAPVDGAYTLRLPAATTPRQRFLEQRLSVDIGGMPLILVEQMTDADAIAQLEFDTFEAETQPVVVTSPVQSALGEAQIAELSAVSPTGVFFYSMDNARLRNLPSTEGTQVITTLRIGQSVPIIGRLADNSWWQVQFEGQSAWVAEFLGEVYGDVNAVPVVEVALPTAEDSSG